MSYRTTLYCRHRKRGPVHVSKLAETFLYWVCLRCRKINRGC